MNDASSNTEESQTLKDASAGSLQATLDDLQENIDQINQNLRKFFGSLKRLGTERPSKHTKMVNGRPQRMTKKYADGRQKTKNKKDMRKRK